MSENLVVDGVTYNGVDSIAMQNDSDETVQYYADAVRYVEQELTESQQEQARENIGATASEVFTAQYGSTTYAQISAAIDAGKVCRCLKTGNDSQIGFLFIDGRKDVDALGHTFSHYDAKRRCLTNWYVTSGNSWNAIAHPVVSKINGIYPTNAGNTNTDGNVVLPAVYYEAQELTDAQKQQARANIGAGADKYFTATRSNTFAELNEKLNSGYTIFFMNEECFIYPLTTCDGAKFVFSGVHYDLKKLSRYVIKNDGKGFVYESADLPQNVVEYTEQSLTDEQKAQARANIGAKNSTVSVSRKTDDNYRSGVEISVTTKDGNTTSIDSEMVYDGYDGAPGKHYVPTVTQDGNVLTMTFTPTAGALPAVEQSYTVELPGGSGSAEAVLYTEQSLTESQKSQARANIGAVTIDDVLSALTNAEGVRF